MSAGAARRRMWRLWAKGRAHKLVGWGGDDVREALIDHGRPAIDAVGQRAFIAAHWTGA